MIKIDDKLINEIALSSRVSERKRLNYNFHKDYNESVQRLINVIQPGSIIKPHLHKKTFEVFVILKGKIRVIEYAKNGKIKETCVLEPNGKIKAVEIKSNILHSIEALEADSAVYIIMEGPYDEKEHKSEFSAH